MLVLMVVLVVIRRLIIITITAILLVVMMAAAMMLMSRLTVRRMSSRDMHCMRQTRTAAEQREDEQEIDDLPRHAGDYTGRGASSRSVC